MHPQIAQRVFHTPILATPHKAAAFALGLGPRLLGVDAVTVEGGDASKATTTNQPFASILDERLGHEIQIGKRNGYAVKDGVAVIPITGSLVHRGAWIGQSSGQTSYEGIGAQIEAAMEDSRVRGIALEIDSHGGEVSGCFSLANRIRAARGDKPIRAFVADHSYSAAYALASQADRIILPQAGGAGSIGVICMHADYSGQLESLGVAVTVIAAGEHKADGNPYEPLPEDVRDALQVEMENLRSIFASTVGEGRGEALTSEAALATQAACLLGEEAVAEGLADEIADPREAFAEFISEINGRGPLTGPTGTAKKETPTMSHAKNEGNTGGNSVETPSAETPPVTQPDADTNTPNQPAGTGSEPDAAMTERERIAGILGSEEAEGREDLANSLALHSSMSVEEAKRHLAASSKAQPVQTLSQEMNGDDTDLDGHEPDASAENPVLAAQRARHAAA